MPVDKTLIDLVTESGWSVHWIDGLATMQQTIESLRPRRFFSALPYEYGFVDFGGAELVATIHGLRPIEMPADRFASKFANRHSEWVKCWLRLLGRDAYVSRKTAEFGRLLGARAARRTFVVPSEFTRRSILQRFPAVHHDELAVFYSPKTELAGHADAAVFDPEALQLTAKRYVLLVSADRWVKNTYRALMAAEAALRAKGGQDWQVAVVGNLPPRFPSRWRHMFRILGRRDVATLSGLYAHAGLLFYPTLNEGFGYPPIEAMSYGTPVLASAISAVPEIAGSGAAYVSPFDSVEMTVRLGWLLADADARSELVVAAQRRYELVEARQERDLQKLCTLLVHE